MEGQVRGGGVEVREAEGLRVTLEFLACMARHPFFFTYLRAQWVTTADTLSPLRQADALKQLAPISSSA